MKSARNLINVVMDGVKDSNMLYDYAECAAREGNAELEHWFKKHADDRTARTQQEWADAKNVLKLDENADEMAICLKWHIEDEIEELKERH